MNNRVDSRVAGTAFGHGRVAGAEYDAGLRAYMLSVYNYMLSGVLLSGMVALGMAMTGAVNTLFNPATGAPSLLGWAAMLSPLAFLFFGFRIERMTEGAAQAMFWTFAALMGVSLSTIFLRYTGTSIATTFFATAVAFGACSLYGYTTQRNLSGFGTFLLMGLVGLIVASILALFLKSGPLAFAISAAGVLIFAGLTAYDTQRIKDMYALVAGTDMAGRSAIMGALSLYLDFVNMFQFMLGFLGNRE